VEDGKLKIAWAPTATMLADGLTRIPRKVKHDKFCRDLNLVAIEDIIIGRRT
jgi:hypothetical protein